MTHRPAHRRARLAIALLAAITGAASACDIYDQSLPVKTDAGPDADADADIDGAADGTTDATIDGDVAPD